MYLFYSALNLSNHSWVGCFTTDVNGRYLLCRGLFVTPVFRVTLVPCAVVQALPLLVLTWYDRKLWFCLLHRPLWLADGVPADPTRHTPSLNEENNTTIEFRCFTALTWSIYPLNPHFRGETSPPERYELLLHTEGTPISSSCVSTFRGANSLALA